MRGSFFPMRQKRLVKIAYMTKGRTRQARMPAEATINMTLINFFSSTGSGMFERIQESGAHDLDRGFFPGPKFEGEGPLVEQHSPSWMCFQS